MNFQDNQEVDALVGNLGILNKQPGVSTVYRLCGEEKGVTKERPIKLWGLEEGNKPVHFSNEAEFGVWKFLAPKVLWCLCEGIWSRYKFCGGV